MSIIQEGGSFQTFNDPQGNPLIALNRDGTITSKGIFNGSIVVDCFNSPLANTPILKGQILSASG